MRFSAFRVFASSSIRLILKNPRLLLRLPFFFGQTLLEGPGASYRRIRKIIHARGASRESLLSSNIVDFYRHPGHVKAIAMYLPQFHRIDENDTWWGEGFTEWTNVRRAKPFYPGHDQPQIPHPDIGYYNLDDPNVLERQASLAAQYGIHGFCFYYYWFNGRRVLEKPINNMLESGKPDFPFCLCWANENWTRTWDGRNTELLLEQSYSAESDIKFFYDILPALKDNRYIRIDGRPLVIIYRPGDLPSASESAKRWQDLAVKEGLHGLHLAAVHSFDFADPRSFGFDSAIQFPPLQTPSHNIATNNSFNASPEFAGNVFNMQDVINLYSDVPQRDYKLFRGVTPRWDNTPRRMERATSWVNSSPEIYGEWLKVAVMQTQRDHPAVEQFLFINAWNEWAEGAYLEPDVRYGYRYLEQTRAALQTEQRGLSESPLDVTSLRHPILFSARQSRLEYVFSASLDLLPSTVNDLLLSHISAISQISSFGLKLSIKHGTAWCHSKSTSIPLTDSDSLAQAYKLASTYSEDSPFVFVVLQYGNPLVTSKCLRSLLELNANDRNVHIVIVDNFHSEKVASETKKMFNSIKQVSLIFNKSNLGFAKGHNVGYKFAREHLGAGFIVALNNDIIIDDSDFVSTCISIYDVTAYSVLGPRILVAESHDASPWNDAVYSQSEWASLQALYEDQYRDWQTNGTAEWDRIGRASPLSKFIRDPILQGAAYIFSPIFMHAKELAFDESTFLYGEEFLLAVGCLLSGHSMLYSSCLSVRHNEGSSTSLLDSSTKFAYGYNGAILSIKLARERLARFSDANKGICINSVTSSISSLCADGRKHLLFDLLFCQPGYHGGGEYGKATFRALIESTINNQEYQIWAALDPTLVIDEWVLELCRKYSVNLVSVTSFADISSLVDAGYFHSFFAPAIVAYADYEYMRRAGSRLSFRGSRTRVVGTLLDIRDYQLIRDRDVISQSLKNIGWQAPTTYPYSFLSDDAPNHLALERMYREILDDSNVETIVTISQYCGDVIMSEFNPSQDRLLVLYAAEKDRPKPVPFHPEDIGNDGKPFVIVLNAARPEKNAASVAAAFNNLFSRNDVPLDLHDARVLFVGINSIAELGLGSLENSNMFTTCNHATPGQLEFLFEQARLLVYASFNEGFGYPPIEAMRYGTASVVSNTTSLPEICGDAVIYCDPYTIESIESAILQAFTSPLPVERLYSHHSKIVRRQRSDVHTLANLIKR
jgi:glycosyltransferase involved in cell wall biosynthesis